MVIAPSTTRAPPEPNISPDISDALECPLCLKLLFHPVTTPCGHTFCKPCLLRAYDHKNTCPFCRTLLMLNPDQSSITITLDKYMKSAFTEDYIRRQNESTLNCHTNECSTTASTENIPLYEMSFVLPGEEIQLNIVEPKYRLLIRRVMDTNRRIGLIGLNEDESLPSIGCVGEVKECVPQHDGRFHVLIKCLNRVRIVGCEEFDGYRVASVENFTDYKPQCPEQIQVVVNQAKELREILVSWTQDILRCGSAQMRVCVESVGPIPSVDSVCDAEALSFWIPRVLPLPYTEKVRLLQMVTTAERLLALKEMMTHSHCPTLTCCVM